MHVSMVLILLLHERIIDINYDFVDDKENLTLRHIKLQFTQEHNMHTI